MTCAGNSVDPDHARPQLSGFVGCSYLPAWSTNVNRSAERAFGARCPLIRTSVICEQIPVDPSDDDDGKSDDYTQVPLAFLASLARALAVGGALLLT
jgi:hypothetical protein